jgi:glycosyltransferase involved in cell wall biosynthesis
MPNKKRKILILVDHFLPGSNAGGSLQSVANLTNLLKDTYDFWILTRNNDFLCKDPYKEIESNKWIERESGIQVYYLSQDNRNYRKFKKIIGALDVDTIYFNSLYSPFFTAIPFLVCVLNGYKMQKVLAPRGELQAGAINIRYPKKITYITLLKVLGLSKNIIWHATDAQEVEDIKVHFGKKANIRIASNVPKTDQLPWKETIKSRGEVRFAFISRVSPKKNLLFFIELLTRVNGKVIFDLYGIVDDQNYWKECEQAINQLPANIEVKYKGSIPNHNVLNVLQNYHFSVLSTLGENFGHSIFEPLLAGRPVLISDRTPWNELQKKGIGWDISLEAKETWQEVIQQCVDMEDPQYNEMSKSAWLFAKDYIDLDALKRSKDILFSIA